MSRTPPRIYADFNGLQASPRDRERYAVPLDTFGSATDLARAGVRLGGGVRLTVFDASDDEEDLEGDAVVCFDRGRRRWIAGLDERGYRYVPARDRDAPRPFVCPACRAERPPHPAEGRVTERCPRRGTHHAAAVAPPDAG